MHAHKVVAHVAGQMANEIYEECARDNRWYAEHRDRMAFVRELAPRMVHGARARLAEMLKAPGRAEDEKEFIMQALMDDITIPRGGRSYVQ